MPEINISETVQVIRDLHQVSPSRDPAQLDEMLLNGTVTADALEPKRAAQEAFIQANIRTLRTQLPNCNGRCTTFGCPDLIVLQCHRGLRGHLVL
jgi:hypothetical protein